MIIQDRIDRFVLIPQSFAPQFAAIPQVLITYTVLDFEKGDCGFLIEADQITVSGFNAKVIALTVIPLYAIQFTYLAVVDSNIVISSYLLDYRTSGIMPQNTYIQFANAFKYIPQVALFVNGALIFRPSSQHYYFQATISEVTLLNFRINLCSVNCDQIKFYKLVYIAALQSHLSTGFIVKFPPATTFTATLMQFNPSVKAYLGGITGLADDESQYSGVVRAYIHYYNSSNQLVYESKQIFDTVLLNFTLSYVLYMPCIGYCVDCINQTSDQCSFCVQGTFRLNPPSCNCQESYYQHGLENICRPCASQCLICSSFVDCLTCMPSTYLNSQNICVNCIPPCQSCISDTQCLSCIDTTYFIDDHQQCVKCDSSCLTCNSTGCLTCQPNYELNSLHQCSECAYDGCIDCQGKLAIQNYECQYVNCNDGVWQYGEQCDNTEPRSGCYYCQITSGYVCENAFLYSSNCKILPYQCKNGEIRDNQIVCTTCKENYQLKDGICFECSKECIGCDQSLNQCTTCRFLNSQVCDICESQQGLYSDYQNNVCYSICGDGIVANGEQCDLGDQTFQEGCKNCQVVPGFICKNNSCYLIDYPIPQLKEMTLYPALYNDHKLFELTYNIPVIANIAQVTYINIDQTNFTFTWSIIDNQTYSLLVILDTACINCNLKIDMVYTQILSYQGVSQQVTQVSSYISDYIILSQFARSAISATSATINYIFIIFLVMVAFAILFGGLETFQNLLDLLQIISYLKYFNTQLPQNLLEFLDIFNIFQFPNLPINLFQKFIKIDTSKFVSLPQPIIQDGYSSSTIQNILPILNIATLSFLIYLNANLWQKTFRYVKFQILCWKLQPYLANRIQSLINYFFTKSHQVIQQWVWNNMIRIVQSSACDISFMICLGIYGLNQSLSTIIMQIDQILTILIIIGYIVILCAIFNINSFHRLTLKSDRRKFEVFTDGIKLQSIQRYYFFFILMKKLIFMLSLILLFNTPILQVTGVLICSIVHSILLNFMNPIKYWHESVKQNMCEVCLTICEFVILSLIIDDYIKIFTYNHRDLFGWLIIALIMIIIVTQLVIDAYQQLSNYYRQYKFFQKIIVRIRKSCLDQ